MFIVYLDEFGHIGPFVSRSDPKYNTSPVFGLSGFCLPEKEVRIFSNWFFKLKLAAFKDEIDASTKHPATWEKKGNEIFTKGRVYKNKRLGFSLINQIKKQGGRIFYHGIEKHQNPSESHPDGLYSTVLSHAIRDIDAFFQNKGRNYLIVLDEHQNRIRLLESALKTMWGQAPATRLLEPPYQVESHLYQTTQAADWISNIIGPLWAFRAAPTQFPDREWAEKYFGTRIKSASTHSSVKLRSRPKQLHFRAP